MKKTIFKGAGVALVTPFKQDGSINFDTLEKLIDFQLKNGTDAIISCGTTGEAATMKPEEKRAVIEFTIKKVNKKIPVVVGTGSNCTEVAIKNSKEAESLGADGILVVTPYYNKTSQAGLIKHFNLIANSVKIPVILYNVPSRTGVNITPETYLELSKHPNIVATKEANGDISSIAKTAALCGENLAIYSGNDDQIIPILSLGGIGVISVFSNIRPQLCRDMVNAYLNGDIEKSREIQLQNLELINAMFCDVNPIPVKEALNLMNFDCGICRMPLIELNNKNKEYLAKIVK